MRFAKQLVSSAVCGVLLLMAGCAAQNSANPQTHRTGVSKDRNTARPPTPAMLSGDQAKQRSNSPGNEEGMNQLRLGLTSVIKRIAAEQEANPQGMVSGATKARSTGTNKAVYKPRPTMATPCKKANKQPVRPGHQHPDRSTWK